jgi:hypothetical protein
MLYEFTDAHPVVVLLAFWAVLYFILELLRMRRR